MPTVIKNKIAEVEKTGQELGDYMSVIRSTVANNSNILESLDGRFDTECVKLNEGFLARMKNDKLVFFFHKKFNVKPTVLITVRSITLNKPSAAGKYKLSQVVNEANVETDRFKFSISIEPKDSATKETLVMSGAEVCYVAFDTTAIKV